MRESELLNLKKLISMTVADIDIFYSKMKNKQEIIKKKVLQEKRLGSNYPKL